MAKRPNLIIVHSHDTGRHLGVYGAPVETPNIRRLAEEGVLFRKAFCASPGCSASRSAMLTGLTPHECGMFGLAHRGFTLFDPQRHLANRLARAGYHTALIGLQHEAAHGQEQWLGYAEADTDLPRHSVPRAERAARWLRARPAEPFYLSLGFVETHREFSSIESPEDERFVGTLPWISDAPETRRDLAELQTLVRHVDQAVGIVLDAVDELGLADNTLVVYTTDHGVPFARAKATLFDAGIGVALVVRGPGIGECEHRGGVLVEHLVSHVDLLPTFAEVAGLEPDPDWQGQSWLHALTGTRTRDRVFAEITYHAAYDPARAVRTDRFKYIRFFEDFPRIVWPNVDDSPSKDILHRAGLPILERPREMLFDLLADPQEFENVAEAPAYARSRLELSTMLDEWMTATNDPIRHGPVPLPKGAFATPHEQYEP